MASLRSFLEEDYAVSARLGLVESSFPHESCFHWHIDLNMETLLIYIPYQLMIF